jgi:hypothetical protein
MRRLSVLFLFVVFVVWAAPKERLWQDARVASIENSTVESEEASLAHSASEGAFPPVNGVIKRRTKIWSYALKTEQHMYVAKVTRKPLEGIHEGDRVRIFVKGGDLFLLQPGGKERKLELVHQE